MAREVLDVLAEPTTFVGWMSLKYLSCIAGLEEAGTSIEDCNDSVSLLARYKCLSAIPIGACAILQADN